MAFGQITAVRVFQNLKTIMGYASGVFQRGWFEEQFSTLAAPELPTLVNAIDKQAAVDQTASLRQEHDDIYGITRDNFYANRSRKWLYTRAYVGKVNGNYEVWASFVRMNMALELSQFNTATADSLSEQPFTELLAIPDPV